MSQAEAIVKAIEIARQSAGDLVQTATLVRTTGYTWVNGVKTPTTEEISVQFVADKISFNERLVEDFTDRDFKIAIFNPNNDLVVSTSDRIIVYGDKAEVLKAAPVYVGGFKVLWQVMLRR